MTTAAHTPEPLQVGRLLNTAQTKQWNDETRRQAQMREERSIYTGFHAGDEGRERRHIASADEHIEQDEAREIIKRLVDCWNALEGHDPATVRAKLGLFNQAIVALKGFMTLQDSSLAHEYSADLDLAETVIAQAREVLVMIGERIRNTRKRDKLSQTELGRLSGYSMNGIAKIERGESDPKYSGLVRIASTLQVDLSYLLTGISDEEREQKLEARM